MRLQRPDLIHPNLSTTTHVQHEIRKKRNDLQLVDVFFIVGSGSLQSDEAAEKKDSKASQVEAVEDMVVMML